MDGFGVAASEEAAKAGRLRVEINVLNREAMLWAFDHHGELCGR
jgi:hypothetical protein